MKQALIVILVCVGSRSAYATMIDPRALDDLVADSDHVLVGEVVKVDMVNAWGFPVRDLEARTGPGSRNEIRLHVVIENDGILKTNKKKVPRRLVIPIWYMWHRSLGGMKYHEGQQYIFLLHGPDFRRTYPDYFMRHPSERPAIEALIPEGKPSNVRLVELSGGPPSSAS